MSTASALLDALSAAVVVGPDDKLVLVFPKMTHKQFDLLNEHLAEHDLKGRVVVIGGGDEVQVSVLRGETS